jgi:flagellar biosynthesis protein FlhF
LKIKRYTADSMRVALAQVRAEQGPDAVILSSRRVEEGIEVIAAVDYDEALFVDATLKRAPAAAYEPAEPAAVAGAPAALQPAALAPAAPAPAAAAPVAAAPEVLAPAAAAAVAAAPAVLAPASLAPAVLAPAALAPAVLARPETAPGRAADGGYLEMQQELKSLRELMHDELKHLKRNERSLRDPLQAGVLEQLTAMDMAPDIARALATLAPRRTRLTDEAHIAAALVCKHLQVVDELGAVNDGVIALVGPTGAGKTTTIAKLAARWSMQHGSRELALVSTDGYRVGAREQLMTYARILGVQMHTANTGAELKWVLERLQAKKLILIDTAGMGPRDVRLSEQLAALKLGAAGARVFLTLPAHGEAHALDTIVGSFAAVAPGACILTKIDEAASLGAVLSTVLRHRLKVAYLCDGQRVPEDLHAAHERRVWLIRSAFKLKEHAPPRVADTYFSRNPDRAPLHA